MISPLDVLRCGISTRPMSARGQSRPSRSQPHDRACRFVPKADIASRQRALPLGAQQQTFLIELGSARTRDDQFGPILAIGALAQAQGATPALLRRSVNWAAGENTRARMRTVATSAVMPEAARIMATMTNW